MTCRFATALGFRLGPLLLLLIATRANAQLNKAYDDGYKPMLDYSSKLKDLVDSAEKRADYNSVKSVAANYKEKLDKVISGLENAGKNMKDGDNQSWIRATCSATLADAKAAKSKAEKLYDKADASQDCKGEALNLQAALTDLSDEFKKCWKEHEERLQKLKDDYGTTLEKFKSSTKEARKPADELGEKVKDARDKFNERQAKARELGKLYLDAQDQSDKMRAELYSADVQKSPDEVKSKFEAWTKADDLVKRVNSAVIEADKAASDAEKSYNDAMTAWEKALAEYDKKESEANDLYKIVQGRHQKAYEMAQEYKPFSW